MKRMCKTPLAAAFVFLIMSAACAAFAAAPSAADVKDIADMITLLRSISPKGDFDISVQTQDQAMNRIAVIRREQGLDTDALSGLVAVYKTLGLIPSGFDLKAAYLAINKDNSRSLYVPSDGKIYLTEPAVTPGWNTPLVKKTMKTLGITETQYLLTREIGRAMLDRNFDASSIQVPAPENSDRTLAARALVNGDVVMIQTDYMLKDIGARSFALEGPMSIIAHFIPVVSLTDKKRLEALPKPLRDRFTFPYIGGYGFALQTRADGGIELLNAAYGAPPVSTEQILHPEKYFKNRDIPIAVSIPQLDSALGPGFKLFYKDVFGELGLRTLLDTKLKQPERAERAAAGWGGDRVVAYKNEKNKTIVAMYTTWDTPEDAVEFQAALNDAFAKDAAATSTIIGRDVVFIYGADKKQAPAAMSAAWESSKTPVIVPPPQAVATTPDSEFFDQNMLLGMLNDNAGSDAYSPDIWKVNGTVFTSQRNGYRLTAPNDNWYFRRYVLGRQIITEFTAFNRTFVGAQITLETFDKVKPGEDDPIDDMEAFIRHQMGDFRKLSDKKIKVAGMPARETVYEGNLIVPVTVRYTEVFAPKRTYIFTCGAFTTFFEKLRPEFDKFINSIELVD